MKTVNDQIGGMSFMNDKEKECSKLHNRWRAVMGLNLLTPEEKKVIAARKHSEYMKNTGKFGHGEDVQGRETPWARCSAEGTNWNGENVAKGMIDPAQALNGWLTSAGHHSLILDMPFRGGNNSKTGIGQADIFWTAVFGP